MSRRAARAACERRLTGFLLAGTAAAVLLVAGHSGVRLDLSEERAFSLAPATRAILERLEDRLQVKLYFNRDIEGAEALLPARLVLQDFLAEVEAAGGGRVSVETLDPTADAAARSAAEAAGVAPIPMPTRDPRGSRIVNVYQGLELRYQDRSEVLPVLIPSEVEFAFAVAVDALLRARRPVLGLWSREPRLLPEIPGAAPVLQVDREFEELRVRLGQRFAVRDVSLAAGEKDLVDLAALIVARPEHASDEELFELDQFLARGGHILLLHDRERVDPRSARPAPLDTAAVDAWLAHFGVQALPPILWDEQGFPFPIRLAPVRLPDGREVQSEPRRVNYGCWPRVEEDGLARDHLACQGIAVLHFLWAHGLELAEPPRGIVAEVLVRSSPHTGALEGELELEPYLENLQRLERRARAAEPRSWPLVVALRGRFPSAWEGRPAPREGRAVVSAAAPGVLVVIGDADLFTNQGIQGLPDSSNAQFAANLLDWLSQEEGLVSLRARGERRRPLHNFYRAALEAAGGLDPALPEEELGRRRTAAATHARAVQRRIAWANVLGPPLLVLALGLAHFAFHRARARRPYRPAGGGAGSG